MRKTGLLLIIMGLAACGAHPSEETLAKATPAPAQSFASWLAEFKQEAAAKGISQEVLADAFDGMDAPMQNILDLDHTQPEKTKTFADYMKGVATARKIAMAQEEWESHADVLKRIEAMYNVPAPMLLALWGVESNFGAYQGSYSITQSLATLAYDGRRSQFFREQLLDALVILQTEHISAQDLTGSWAGAMGQTQFMPSSFLKFAVDFDGDGTKDIWNSDADALASIANYLHQKGWDPHYGWGMAVTLPIGDMDWQSVKGDRTAAQWQSLGVRSVNGKALRGTMPVAHLVMPDNDPASAFLAFPNYNVLMDWNRSTYFATGVGLLADAIAKR